MMFIIFGLRSKTNAVEGGAQREHFCSQCGQNRVFRESRRKDYISLYFVLLIPVSAGDTVMSCSVCDSNYILKEGDARHAAVQQLPDVKTLVRCVHCQGKMRVPKVDRALIVTCPLCSEKFQVG